MRGGVALGRGGRWDTVGKVDHCTALVTWDPLSDVQGIQKVKKSQNRKKSDFSQKSRKLMETYDFYHLGSKNNLFIDFTKMSSVGPRCRKVLNSYSFSYPFEGTRALQNAKIMKILENPNISNFCIET